MSSLLGIAPKVLFSRILTLSTNSDILRGRYHRCDTWRRIEALEARRSLIRRGRLTLHFQPQALEVHPTPTSISISNSICLTGTPNHHPNPYLRSPNIRRSPCTPYTRTLKSSSTLRCSPSPPAPSFTSRYTPGKFHCTSHCTPLLCPTVSSRWKLHCTSHCTLHNKPLLHPQLYFAYTPLYAYSARRSTSRRAYSMNRRPCR